MFVLVASRPVELVYMTKVLTQLAFHGFLSKVPTREYKF